MSNIMKMQKLSPLINRKILIFSLIVPILFFTGSSYGARNDRNGPSHGVQGATKGGLGGAVLGALIGAAAGDAGKGAAIGAVSGLVLGGAVGHSRDVREREEDRYQERLGQERAYQQEVIVIGERESREAKQRVESLAIQEGYNITPIEVRAAQKRADEAERRLNELQAEVAEAKTRDNSLKEAIEREDEAEAKIRELEAQLKALKKANEDDAAESPESSN